VAAILSLGDTFAAVMPHLQPFRGLRYTLGPDLSAVLAPPYDVIDDAERKELATRSEYNAVHVEVPQDDGPTDRYTNAGCLIEAWTAGGALARDHAPTMTAYRMTYTDESGTRRVTTGVLGGLPMTEGGLLPHEHTTPKAKDDRLNLLRACKTNVSPIWALAPTPGLTALLETTRQPDAYGTDDDGVVHEAWIITDVAALDAIGRHLAASPLIVADGHHRFEVARAYRDERRAANGGRDGDYDAVLAYVVELDDEQLTVGPIHRLIADLPTGFDVVAALSETFDVEAVDEPVAFGVVTRDGAWRLTPRDTDAHSLDSSRIVEALERVPAHTLTYQHGKSTVLRAVHEGRADAAVLLRPATVEQIAETGRSGVRMPPKTTFFWPKPRTGLVYRPVED
jgi:uncharacterized protein (DUF1015 family)